MKTYLMYKTRDFDMKHVLPAHADALTQDLELEVLFKTMAGKDELIHQVAKTAILIGETDSETIRYRQEILKDCLTRPAEVRALYAIAAQAIEKKQKNHWSIFSRYPSSILRGSVEIMRMFVAVLRELRTFSAEHAAEFTSEGFRNFFAMIEENLDEGYFLEIERHLKALRFDGGILMSAVLGKGNEGTGYVLRKPKGKRPSFFERVFMKSPAVYSFSLHPRDESGARCLSELSDQGINLVANAVARSADHVSDFFNLMKTELAFYIGCVNLKEALSSIGEPAVFPGLASQRERRHSFRGLYDVCLALTMGKKVVANSLNLDSKNLVVVTGANQGGKSTFLRSIGLAQIMMQCGMFVPAEAFEANLSVGIFTHYKREEDSTMKSGKLDEELARMSGIVEGLLPDSLVLFNESFSATNEREGSEIARQIVTALLESGMKVFFVTHLYDFANRFHDQGREDAASLRAERRADGSRTFRVVEGEPLRTSFGEDIYKKIFESDGKADTVSAERPPVAEAALLRRT